MGRELQVIDIASFRVVYEMVEFSGSVQISIVMIFDSYWTGSCVTEVTTKSGEVDIEGEMVRVAGFTNVGPRIALFWKVMEGEGEEDGRTEGEIDEEEVALTDGGEVNVVVEDWEALMVEAVNDNSGEARGGGAREREGEEEGEEGEGEGQGLMEGEGEGEGQGQGQGLMDGEGEEEEGEERGEGQGQGLMEGEG